ncbi:iron complex outermembrane recepter protein [Arachidicoccus rhizosphaerae]|uniref:Iron complex outermembrane recepter protein n=1 Tax=Arachidicoccus rhizosphaerae TaxID=551991 RepID=A0A1H3Y4G3_9BACT|nr:TonB-dependent receptor [Arachidicoccus rhizosphaerae]SEA06607.1 iron complex outermembrane recepter protein [Arachidicoccus rhizosphaerae]
MQYRTAKYPLSLSFSPSSFFSVTIFLVLLLVLGSTGQLNAKTPKSLLGTDSVSGHAFTASSGEDVFTEGTLEGVITDKKTGAPISGASIFIPDLKIGAVTDSAGHYAFKHLPKGIYLVHITAIGYGAVNQKLNFDHPQHLNVTMQESWVEADQVIVTGLSKATTLKRDPVPMVAVSKTYMDIHAASGNVIAELASVPGVSAVTTGPNVAKPFIRGLGYNRVVTAENGIRLEGQQWGDEHGIEVDQNAINNAEIIKGPASLSFGPDAIGGVVNLITAPTVPEGSIKGSVTGLYGTNNGLVNGSVALQGNQGGFVWGAVASAKNAKNYQNQHDGRVYGTNFKERDARFMVGLNKKWGYSYLHASLFDDEQAIPDGSRDSATRAFTRQITEADEQRQIVPASVLNSYDIPTLHQRVQLYRIYNTSNIKLGGGNLLLNLGYQYSHRREFTHPEKPELPGLNLELQTYTYDAKYNFVMGTGYEATVGINGMYQDNGFGEGTDFPIPAYHQFDFGPFFVIKRTFNKLDLSAGARYDTRSFKGKAAYIDNTDETYPRLYTGADPLNQPGVEQQFQAMKRNFNGPSGSLGATYNFSNSFLLKGNISTGFRSPSIAELSANGADPGSQIYHVGNQDFKPEYSVQGDLGAFLTQPKWTASAELFVNHIENYIYQQQLLDATGQPERVDAGGNSDPNGQYSKFGYVQSKARIMGGEFNIDIHPFKWLHFANSMTLTYGTNLGTGTPVADSLKYLPFIPPMHTHSELRGEWQEGFGPFKNLYAFCGFDHYNQQDRFFAAYGTETYTAGYNLLGAGIGAKVASAKGRELFSLYIEGTNLLDKSYQSNMSRLKYFDNPNVPEGVQPGIFNMGRNISFKVVVPLSFKTLTKVAG